MRRTSPDDAVGSPATSSPERRDRARHPARTQPDGAGGIGAPSTVREAEARSGVPLSRAGGIGAPSTVREAEARSGVPLSRTAYLARSHRLDAGAG